MYMSHYDKELLVKPCLSYTVAMNEIFFNALILNYESKCVHVHNSLVIIASLPAIHVHLQVSSV